VSDHECAASATIAADPVTPAAADFATASSALAVRATTTVKSDEPTFRPLDSWDTSGWYPLPIALPP
jgi:hypothetical protein